VKKVVVTGANGHVGYSVAKLLVERGYDVRATVRDASDPAKTAHLKALDVEIAEADLMRPETLAPVMEGRDGLFQVAAVYRSWARDPQREIIDPSIIGGVNTLRAAHAAGIERVVFTSSTAAVGRAGPGDAPLTEADWNDASPHPYSYAKTEAEHRAWTFAEENSLDLIVINPTAVIGPGFHRHTPSTAPYRALLRGELRRIPPIVYGLVDARDVAMGHVLAYETRQARGRHILCTECLPAAELVELVHDIDPEIKVPTRHAALWQVRALARWEQVRSWFGREPRLTPETVREYLGKPTNYDSSKARRELGWHPLPIRQTVRDTLEWVREHPELL